MGNVGWTASFSASLLSEDNFRLLATGMLWLNLWSEWQRRKIDC